MAGTVTVEESGFFGVCKIKWSWTSTTGGAADLTTVKSYYGEVIALVTNPTDGPTDNYDVTITDADGYDVMQGAGADRDTSNTETAVPAATSVAFGRLTLNVTAAGSTKSGTAVLYIRGGSLGG